MSPPRRFGAGTAANAIHGLGPAALSALLPLLLVSSLPRVDFAVWSLATSIAAYVVVFQIGIQQAVAAAAGRLRNSTLEPDNALPLAAALQFLAPLMTLASAGAVAVAVFAGTLFPGVPRELRDDFRVSLLILFSAAVASSVSSVIWGQALGVGRLRAPIVSSLAGRGVGFGAALVAAHLTTDLKIISAAFALPIIASVPAQARSVHLTFRLFSKMHRRTRKRYRRGYAKAVRTLAAWSLGMLMVTGIDGAVVGRFDFIHTGVYVLVATIVSVIVAGIGSWQAPFLAYAHSVSDPSFAPHIRRVARLAMLLNINGACFAAIPVWLVLDHLLTRTYAHMGYMIFVILIAASTLRQFTVPATLLSIASERYQRLVLPTMIEGAVNLTLSVILCAQFGAVGVAVGTFIGAIALNWVLLAYTFREPSWVLLDRTMYLRVVLARPLGVLIFPAALTLLTPFATNSPVLVAGSQLLFVTLTACLTWYFCLDPDDRVRAKRLAWHKSTGHEAKE